MALSVAVRTFSWLQSSSAGTTIDVTLGFQPKAVIVWHVGNGSTVDNVARDWQTLSMGFGISDSERRNATYTEQDASGTANVAIGHYNNRIVGGRATGDGSLDIDAVANWPSDGIRFIVDNQLVTQLGDQRVIVLGIGGTDITDVNVFDFTEPGATGAQAVPHGLSATPTGAFFASVGLSAVINSTGTASGMFSFGATDGTRSWVNYIGQDDANTTMDTVSYGKTGEVIALGPEPAVTLNGRASVTSFDGTNINLDWTERASTRRIIGIAWTGGQFRADSVTTRTDTTGFNGPTNGFIASAALFASVNRAESTADTPTAHSQISLGAAVSTTERAASSAHDEDGVGTSEVTTAIEHDAVYINISTASAIQGLMDVTDVSADPWALVMDDADPSASWVGVASWGAATGGVQSGAWASAGVAAISYVGNPLFSGVLASNGVGALTGVGRSTAASVLNAGGVGAFNSVGETGRLAVWAAAGIGALAAVGAPRAAAALASAGAAVLSATGQSTAAAALSAAGVAVLSGVGASRIAASGAMDGVGAVSWVGGGNVESAVWASNGVGDLSGVGRSTAESVWASAGVGLLTNVGRSFASATLSAAGVGEFTPWPDSTAPSVWTSAGVGGLDAAGNTVVSGVMSSAGVATVSYAGASIASAVWLSSGVGGFTALGDTDETVIRTRMRFGYRLNWSGW